MTFRSGLGLDEPREGGVDQTDLPLWPPAGIFYQPLVEPPPPELPPPNDEPPPEDPPPEPPPE